MSDKAIGWIREDLSKDLAADEKSIRDAAEWSDLDLVEVLVSDTEPSVLRLLDAINRHRATVVVTPAAAHLQVGRALEEMNISMLCSRLIRPANREAQA